MPGRRPKMPGWPYTSRSKNRERPDSTRPQPSRRLLDIQATEDSLVRGIRQWSRGDLNPLDCPFVQADGLPNRGLGPLTPKCVKEHGWRSCDRRPWTRTGALTRERRLQIGHG